jgi:hypothetical protein
MTAFYLRFPCGHINMVGDGFEICPSIVCTKCKIGYTGKEVLYYNIHRPLGYP